MKRMKVKLLIVALLCVVALFSVSARGQKEGTTEGDSLYTIKVLDGGLSTLFSDTPVGAVIREKFNIDFEFEQYTGNWQEKVSLWLAGGDYPEIVPFHRSPEILKKYINAGALYELDNLVEEYGPNFKKTLKEQIPHIRHMAGDGKIYFWPERSPSMHELVNVPFDMPVQIKALEMMGYPKLRTTDQWYDFYVGAMAKYKQAGTETVGITMPMAWEPMLPLIPGAFRDGGRYVYISGTRMLMLDCETDSIDYILRTEYELEVT